MKIDYAWDTNRTFEEAKKKTSIIETCQFKKESVKQKFTKR